MFHQICKIGAFRALFECPTDSPNDIKQHFLYYCAKYGYSYKTKKEFDMRFKLYEKKDSAIKKENAKKENSFLLDHNRLSVYTDDEYSGLLGHRPTLRKDHGPAVLKDSIPASVDWRTQGIVNAVKNQGQCGSCWAFAATSAIESAHAQKTVTLYSLSEQQVVDCDTTCYGCNGGLADLAFEYLETANQELETDYPYTAADGTCKYRKSKGKVGVTSYSQVTRGSNQQLLKAIAKQPVAVGVEADNLVFQMYTSGIINSTSCGTNTDHAITAIGYGQQNGQYYYIVRNSWGADWGNKGYVNISAAPGGPKLGYCGILSEPSYPQTS